MKQRYGVAEIDHISTVFGEKFEISKYGMAEIDISTMVGETCGKWKYEMADIDDSHKFNIWIWKNLKKKFKRELTKNVKFWRISTIKKIQTRIAVLRISTIKRFERSRIVVLRISTIKKFEREMTMSSFGEFPQLKNSNKNCSFENFHD